MFDIQAACCAVTFTNPPEVIKTRLQLQGKSHFQQFTQSKLGELIRKSNKPIPKIYTGLIQAAIKIYKTEGIRGLQRVYMILKLSYLY